MMIGALVVVTGVIWVSLAKGKVSEMSPDLTESEIFLYRLLSISAALFTGVLNCLRTF